MCRLVDLPVTDITVDVMRRLMLHGSALSFDPTIATGFLYKCMAACGSVDRSTQVGALLKIVVV